MLLSNEFLAFSSPPSRTNIVFQVTHIDEKHRDERQALPWGLQMKRVKLTGRRAGGEGNQPDSARKQNEEL